MRSAADDRTARAVIRAEALRLFAAHGADAVTVRQIAAAAGLASPGADPDVRAAFLMVNDLAVLLLRDCLTMCSAPARSCRPA